MSCGNPFFSLDDHLSTGRGQIKVEFLAAQTLCHQIDLRRLRQQRDAVVVEKETQDFFSRVIKRFQNNAGGEFSAPVDPHEQQIFLVEFKIQPGSPVGNHPGVEEQFPRRVGLSFIVIEEDARRAMQLRDNHPLRAINDKRAVLSHQGHLAHVDFLLLDIAQNLRAAGFAFVKNNQAQRGKQRRRVHHAALLALADIEHRSAEGVTDKIQ